MTSRKKGRINSKRMSKERRACFVAGNDRKKELREGRIVTSANDTGAAAIASQMACETARNVA